MIVFRGLITFRDELRKAVGAIIFLPFWMIITGSWPTDLKKPPRAFMEQFLVRGKKIILARFLGWI